MAAAFVPKTLGVKSRHCVCPPRLTHERGFASSASFSPSPLSGQRIVRKRPGFVTPFTLHWVEYWPPQVLQRSGLALPPDARWLSLGMGDGAESGGVSRLYLHEPVGHPIRSLSLK